jgi:hypothetical protein
MESHQYAESPRHQQEKQQEKLRLEENSKNISEYFT